MRLFDLVVGTSDAFFVIQKNSDLKRTFIQQVRLSNKLKQCKPLMNHEWVLFFVVQALQ